MKKPSDANVIVEARVVRSQTCSSILDRSCSPAMFFEDLHQVFSLCGGFLFIN